MRKLLGSTFVLLATLFMGYGQQDNNTNDDVYYNDPSNNAMIGPQIDQQNYDDENNYNDGPTYQTFYDQLSPYGSWVNYPGYGYCWLPNNVDVNFSPYMTNGHWVYTDMGWTWVSDFQWGWATFHYGRWLEDPYYGWIWVPGFDWAPAWVIWGDYDGYYGWACLGPRDILSPHFRPEPRHWHFVEHQYMGREDFDRHIMRHDEVVGHDIDVNAHINIIAHANTYHQSVFFGGPKPEEVEHYSGQKITRMQINNVSAPTQTRISGNQVNIYRPNIVRNNVQNQNVTPNKVVNTQDLKPQPNRVQPNQINVEPTREQHNQPVRQEPTQQWSPPRQSTQPQRQNFTPQQQPQRQNFTPQQQPQRQFNAPAQQPVQRTFVPSERPAMQQQQQHFSAPQQQQHFSAPSQPRGGNGRR